MNKFPKTVPSETSTKKLIQLVKTLPGFKNGSECSEDQVLALRRRWQEEYDDNLDKITFENLSSYEP